MPTKSGGDPPQQQILEFVDRLAPKGLLAEATLAHAGFDDPKDAAKKLRGSGLDLTPSADGPRRVTAGRAPEKPVERAQAAPAYSDEVKSEASILPPRWTYWRRRTGPTQSGEFGLRKAMTMAGHLQLFQSGEGLDRFALAEGKAGRWIELAEQENWRLQDRADVEATVEAIGRITFDAKEALEDIERQGYHILESDRLRPEWRRPEPIGGGSRRGYR